LLINLLVHCETNAATLYDHLFAVNVIRAICGVKDVPMAQHYKK